MSEGLGQIDSEVGECRETNVCVDIMPSRLMFDGILPSLADQWRYKCGRRRGIGILRSIIPVVECSLPPQMGNKALCVYSGKKQIVGLYSNCLIMR